MTDLRSEHPREYPKGTPGLSDDEIEELSLQVPGWDATDDKLSRRFQFHDFNEAFGFISRVALLAETEQHHPDIHNSWNQVTLEFWTHTVDGLTRNDFIMAAKVNTIGLT